MSNNNNNNEEVFVYMGVGSVVPNDIVSACVHPSVTIIPSEAFRPYNDSYVMSGLGTLKHITIPSTVTMIGHRAFYDAPLVSINLPDSVWRIDEYAFFAGKFSKVRIPPLVTNITGVFSWCDRLFSVEIPEGITNIGVNTFTMCPLRNVALPHGAEVFIPTSQSEWGQDKPFQTCSELKQLFDSQDVLVNALKCRFDNLPIHKMLYYQSYQPVTQDQLIAAVEIRYSQRRSKLNPTGRQRDCLGMTPLHILACSTSQHLELYQVLIKRFPENLITEDEWGAVPLLYAVWGNAPREITQFLATSIQSLHPDYKFNWVTMMEALIEGSESVETFQNLLDMHEEFFTDQCIHWEAVLDKAAAGISFSSKSKEFQFLVQYSISKRVKDIGLKYLRCDITDSITNYPNGYENVRCNMGGNVGKKKKLLVDIRNKLDHYEKEYLCMKEATSMIELALWKIKIDDIEGEGEKKTNLESPHAREQCRISCGADTTIAHVLPYLMPPLV